MRHGSLFNNTWTKLKRIRKLNTRAIKPETSHKENPMKAHLIKTSKISWIGLREIDKIRHAKINPTPIATPAKEINGMLEATNLKPSNNINNLLNKIKILK